MPDDHSCVGNLEPIIDDYDPGMGEPILSATVGLGGGEVYLECTECGQTVTAEFEYADFQFHDD